VDQPIASWVCRGEMQTCTHPFRGIPPYPFGGNFFTAGSVGSMPTPPGTCTGFPSTKTSRCAWTWELTNPLGSGVRPACRASVIGSGGSDQEPTSPPVASVGGFGVPFDDDPP